MSFFIFLYFLKIKNIKIKPIFYFLLPFKKNENHFFFIYIKWKSVAFLDGRWQAYYGSDAWVGECGDRCVEWGDKNVWEIAGKR